jgi:hypothetical protein
MDRKKQEQERPLQSQEGGYAPQNPGANVRRDLKEAREHRPRDPPEVTGEISDKDGQEIRL